MGMYEKLKKQVEKASDALYFSLGRRLRKSTLASRENVILFLSMLILLFLISGGLVAWTNPAYIGQIFSQGTASQTAAETILFFFLNVFAFVSIYLMDRGIKRASPDMTTFLTGLILFFSALAAIWYVVSVFKGFR